jgi:UDP-N-acetylglucosamine acyltransferase
MSNIHPTAIISPKAKLGNNISIGPFSIIQDDVEIEDDCSIASHVVVYNGARIGKRVRIYQSASVAHTPQDLKFKGEPTKFIIGNDTTIHEFVTLHRGTLETGFSRIGNNCLIMAYAHVAHDCVVGDNCIIANAAQMAGHVIIEDWVTIGGLTAIHQFCTVGQHSMIGGGFKTVMDIPPFVLAYGNPARYAGLNKVGLKRRGFSNSDLDNLKQAYHLLYNSGLLFSQAKKKIEEELGEIPIVRTVLDFLNKSTRGIIRR